MAENTGNYGTPADMKETWDWCMQAPPLRNMGYEPKCGRWLQLFDKTRQHLDHWAPVEMILTYVGRCEGWFTDGSETEVSGVLKETDNPLPPGTKGGKGSGKQRANCESIVESAPTAISEVRVPVAQSNKGLDPLRRKCHNMMHMAACVYANLPLRGLWCILVEIIRPIEEEHGKCVTILKTQMGCREWVMKNSLYQGFGYLIDVLAGLRSECACYRGGLILPSMAPERLQLSSEAMSHISKKAFLFTITVVGLEVQWLRRYGECPLELSSGCWIPTAVRLCWQSCSACGWT